MERAIAIMNEHSITVSFLALCFNTKLIETQGENYSKYILYATTRKSHRFGIAYRKNEYVRNALQFSIS